MYFGLANTGPIQLVYLFAIQFLLYLVLGIVEPSSIYHFDGVSNSQYPVASALEPGDGGSRPPSPGFPGDMVEPRGKVFHDTPAFMTANNAATALQAAVAVVGATVPGGALPAIAADYAIQLAKDNLLDNTSSK